MIDHIDLEQLAGADQITGDFDVSLRRGGIAAGMVMRQSDGAAGCYNYRPKHFPWMHGTYPASRCDKVVAQDASPGIEDQDDKGFLSRIKPVGDGMLARQ